MFESIRTTHSLPGRLRLAVPIMRNRPYLADAMRDELLSTDGILLAKTGLHTGSLLVMYDSSIIDEDTVVDSVLKFRDKGNEPYRSTNIESAIIHPTLAGAALAATGLRQLSQRTGLEDVNSTANALPIASAAIGVMSGYPSLRRGIRSVFRRRINTDLLLSIGSFGLLATRGSAVGLTVLTLYSIARAAERQSRQRALSLIKTHSPETGTTELVDASDVKENRLASISWYTAGAMLLLGRGPIVALTALIAGSPKNLGTGRAVARANAVTTSADVGVLITNPDALKTLSEASTLVVDLPVLLTSDNPEITSVIAYGKQYSKDRIIAMVAAAVSSVNKPLYNALCTKLREVGGVACRPVVAELLHGQGVNTIIDGTHLLIGDMELLEENGIHVRRSRVHVLRIEARGHDVLGVAHGGKLIGVIGLANPIKPDAEALVQRARALGYHRIFVRPSGGVGYPKALATSIGIDGIWTDGCTKSSLPEPILFITQQDSNNRDDSVVLMSSDEPEGLLIGNDLSKIANLLMLCRQEREIERQNELISIGTGISSLALVATNALNLPSALLLSDLTSLALIANSRRLRMFSPEMVKPIAKLAPVAACLEEELSVPEWHSVRREELSILLSTSTQLGLTSREANRRLHIFGLNDFIQSKPPSFFSLFLRQFSNAMVLALLGASGVAAAAGGIRDAATIVGTLIINGLFGAYQEYSTDCSVTALKRLTAPSARVIRDGKLCSIPSSRLVPGDIIELEAGDRIPADCRIIDSSGMQAEESSITGESVPVTKSDCDMAPGCVPLGDRANMAYMGTGVTRGHARAIVLHTGMATEMGSILAMMNESAEPPSPLQRAMDAVGRTMLAASLAVAGSVIVAGLLRGNPLMVMIMTGVSVAVAAIPEGLPITVTLALTAGVKRMATQRAIARKLSAIETLGVVSIICSDKTGTITQNRMNVRSIYTRGESWESVHISGSSSERAWRERCSLCEWPSSAVLQILEAATACCDGIMRRDVDGRGASGSRERTDPMDAALQRLHDEVVNSGNAAAHGWLDGRSCLAEVPFDADRKRVTVVIRSTTGNVIVITKGAIDAVLPLCSGILTESGIVASTQSAIEDLETVSSQMMAKSLRILGVAYKELDSWDEGTLVPLEDEMTFMGFVGMIDPPRPEIPKAMRLAKRAGVGVMMVTGDHPDTARSIASELGMPSSPENVLTGAQLDNLSDDELTSALPGVSVFARVTPRHKLRIVKCLQKIGHVIAMTGDGVNDAPAIKEADIGVAMGGGTETTKEASDLVITDDSFASIVSAMREGRGVRRNIRNAIGYNMGGNTGEVIAMLLGIAAGMPLPLLPIQLLLLNLLSDGLPVFALATAMPDEGVMDGHPIDPNESLFARGLGRQIIIRGMIIGATAFGLYWWALRTGSIARARSIALASLVVSQWAQVPDWEFGGCPSRYEGRRRDSRLAACVALPAIAFPLVFHLPFVAGIFGTVPLLWIDWLLIATTSWSAGSLSRIACSPRSPRNGCIVPGVVRTDSPSAVAGSICDNKSRSTVHTMAIEQPLPIS